MNDTITITLPSDGADTTDTITITSSDLNIYDYSVPSFYSDTIISAVNTVSPVSSTMTNYSPTPIFTTSSYSSIDTSWLFTPQPTPFISGFPEWDDFTNMRNEYPTLDNAFENLKIVYKLCESDWESTKRESQ